MLSVLSLFTLEQPEWTVEDAARELDLTLSTAYRYFRSLTSAGLLIALSTGRYVLGPAIIQYDRQIRLHDPLITAAQPVMKDLMDALPTNSVVLLCRLFRDQVMCVHQEFRGRPHFAVGYERGRLMPLFRGAASKIILAHMPLRSVRALYDEHAPEFGQADLGKSWDEVKERLRALRVAGQSVTRGEVDAGLCGLSVPILEDTGAVMGSLSLVLPARHFKATMSEKLFARLRQAAQKISGRRRV
jgi:DNA-binding IclR family transcriptional regulator